MPIRMIARQLYSAQQKVEQLEKELAIAPRTDHEAINEKLRIARAEWQQIRHILDGEKIRPER